MLMLWVISTNTAVLYFVALATIIPIVSLLSTSALYSTIGLCKVAFSPLQIVGLLTVVLGIVVYRLHSEEEIEEGQYSYRTDQGDTTCVYHEQSVSDRIRDLAAISSTHKFDPEYPSEHTPHDQDLLNASFQSWESEGSRPSREAAKGAHREVPTPGRSDGWDQHAKDID